MWRWPNHQTIKLNENGELREQGSPPGASSTATFENKLSRGRSDVNGFVSKQTAGWRAAVTLPCDHAVFPENLPKPQHQRKTRRAQGAGGQRRLGLWGHCRASGSQGRSAMCWSGFLNPSPTAVRPAPRPTARDRGRSQASPGELEEPAGPGRPRAGRRAEAERTGPRHRPAVPAGSHPQSSHTSPEQEDRCGGPEELRGPHRGLTEINAVWGPLEVARKGQGGGNDVFIYTASSQ